MQELNYSDSATLFTNSDISLKSFIFLLILVPIGAFVVATIMNTLSSQVSRIAAYHKNEGLKTRVKNLINVYFSIGVIMYLYGAITLLATIDGVRLSDSNIAYVIIIVAGMLPVSIRIITTTQLVLTTKLEESMGIDFRTNRERYLSLLNSYLSVVLAISVFGAVYMLVLIMDGTPMVKQLPEKLTFDTIGTVYVILAAIIFPIISATIGELMRYIVFKLYESDKNILPDDFFLD